MAAAAAVAANGERHNEVEKLENRNRQRVEYKTQGFLRIETIHIIIYPEYGHIQHCAWTIKYYINDTQLINRG